MYLYFVYMKNAENNDLTLRFLQIEQRDCELDFHSRCLCFSVLSCNMQIAASSSLVIQGNPTEYVSTEFIKSEAPVLIDL